jgi:hypothetical protein
MGIQRVPRGRTKLINHARKQLDWQPRAPSRQGMKVNVASFRLVASRSQLVPSDIRQAIQDIQL